MASSSFLTIASLDSSIRCICADDVLVSESLLF
nr:MAG TPA: hypothetical protein [Caudoviricetes sp.]